MCLYTYIYILIFILIFICLYLYLYVGVGRFRQIGYCQATGSASPCCGKRKREAIACVIANG